MDDDLDLTPLIEDLDDSLDNLESVLAPLLKTDLTKTAAQLPLLDRAKLYVLVTYAIESLIFSTLKINGDDVKEHPVMRELTRVKQYFEKISRAESNGEGKGTAPDMPPGVKPDVALNKDAAARMIKHGLAGNDRYDRARAERTGAKRKLDGAEEPHKEGKRERKSKEGKKSRKERKDASADTSAHQATPDLAAPHEAAAGDAAPGSSSKKHKSQHGKKKTKLNSAPKSSKQIFKDLLDRPSKDSAKS